MRGEYDFNQGIKNPYTKERIHFVGSDESDTKDMTDRTIEYYNDNTQDFIAGTVGVDVSDLRNRFLETIPQGGTILDLGCGSGRDTKAFIEMGYDVRAIDGSPELCREATEFSGCCVECKDFFAIDDVEQYDGIWACASILHVKKDRIPDLLLILCRALRLEGTLYLSFKYGDFDGFRDGRYFVDLDEKGFQQVYGRYLNLYGLGLSMKEEWISEDVRRDRPAKWLNEILRKE